MPGQDYNRPTTTCCAELLQEREAAHAWHSEIHEEAAGSKLGVGIEKRLPRVERLWLEAGSAKEMIEPLREVQIVVHYIHDHRCDAHAALRTWRTQNPSALIVIRVMCPVRRKSQARASSIGHHQVYAWPN